MYTFKQHIKHVNRLCTCARALLVFCCLIIASHTVTAQVLTNEGAVISIKDKTVVQAGDVENHSGAIQNNGTLNLTGNWKNNASFSDTTGVITFNGSRFQRIFKTGGESFYNFEINSTGDSVNLDNNLQVKGRTKVEKGQLSTKYDIEFLGQVLCGKGKISAWAGNINYPQNALNIIAGTYYNLTLKGSSVKYLCGNVRVLNRLTIEGGTLELGQFDLVVDGTTIVSGTISDNNDRGTNIFKGLVSLNPGSGWNFSGDGNIEFQGGILHNGVTFISGNGIYKFTTNNQLIAGNSAMTIDGEVHIERGVQLNNTLEALGSGLTINNRIDGTDKTAIFKNEGIVNYQHASIPMNNGILDATAAGNIFRYSGETQGIAAGPVNGNYFHLVISGSKTKTFLADVHVAGNLTIGNNTTLAFGGDNLCTLSVDGSLSALDGNIDMRNGRNVNHTLKLYGLANDCANLLADDQSRIEYLGGNNQQVFASQNYRNISFAGTGLKILKGDIKASGNTFIISTNVDAGIYELYLASDLASIERIAGAFIGKIKRRIERVSINYLFPVGTDTSYNSLVVNFEQLSKGDYLVEFQPADPGTEGLPLNDEGVDIHDRFENGLWKTKAVNGLASENYSIFLDAENFGVDVASRIVKKDINGLYLNGRHGVLQETIISRNGLSGISTISTIFAIGKGRPTIFIHASNDTVCFNSDAHFSINAGGHAPVSYQWYRTGNPDIKLNDGEEYRGTTTNTLTVVSSVFSDQGSFYCIVTDPANHSVIGANAILKVNRIPEVILSATRDTICDNSYAYIKISPAASDTIYTWQVSQDNGLNGANAGTGIFIDQILKNNNLFASKVIYSIKGTGPSPTFCESPVVNDTIIVNPTPQVFALALHDTICYNEGTNVEISSLVSATSKVLFNLNIESDGGVTGFRNNGDYSLGTFSDGLLNSTPDTQHIAYVLKPYIENIKAGLSCENGVVTKVVVKINPQASINIAALADTLICHSEGVNIKIDKTNPTHIGKWLYDVKAMASSTDIKGYSENATGLDSDLLQAGLTNTGKKIEWVEYTFIPRIQSPRIGLNNCEDGAIKKIKVYVNPMPDLQVFASEDTLCYEQPVLFNISRQNGPVEGLWKYHLKVSSTDNNVVGFEKELNDIDSLNIYDLLTNNSSAKQTISYHFVPVIKNPRNSKSYCEVGHDTTIYVQINPRPRIFANISENLYCDSATVNFNIQSKNGEVMGQKYYWVKASYDSSRIKPDQAVSGYYSVGTHAHNLINLTDSIQTITYFVKGIIKDPKAINSNDYCQAADVEYDTTFTLEVLPLLKAKLTPLTYRGGWDIKCFGESNGAINLALSGGMVAKGMTDKQAVYKWNNGATTRDIKNVKAGDYVVRVTDTKSCRAWSEITLHQPEKLVVNAQVKDLANCSSLKSGKIVASITGGTPAYYVSWSSGSDTILRNDTVASDLSLGEYFVHVRDSNYCYAKDSETFYRSDNIIVSINGSEYSREPITPENRDIISIYGVSCIGANNGFMEPTVNEEPGIDYDYTWYKIIGDEPIEIHTNQNSVENVGKGLYMLYVKNNAGCDGAAYHEIIEPPAVKITPFISKGLSDQYQITCDTSKDGSIIIDAVGGYNNFSYKWKSNKNIADSISPEIYNLDEGTYFLTVQDHWYQYENTGFCEFSYSYELKKPEPLELSYTSSIFNGYNTKCVNSEDGWIEAQLSKGVPGYTYKWTREEDNYVFNENLPRISNLKGGTYILHAGYGNKCGSQFIIKLNKPDSIKLNNYELSLVEGGHNISCFSAKDGFIKTDIIGGVGSYTFTWSNIKAPQIELSNTKELKNQPAGDYKLLVSDLNDCLFQDTFSLTQPEKVEVFVESFPVNCKSDENGEAHITDITGGTAPFTYLWSNGKTDKEILGLNKGVYSVAVTDANKCTGNAQTEVKEPDTLILDLQISSNYQGRGISCFGKNDGSLFAKVSGGRKPYRFTWGRLDNTTDTTKYTDTAEIQGLSKGIYYVFVVDKSNCTQNDSIIVKEPDSMTLTLEIQQVSCYEKNNGSITAHVTGGTLPYNYSWSNDSIGPAIEKLEKGKYSLVAKDANGCTIIDSAIIYQPDSLYTLFAKKDPYCPATKDGWASLEISGGTLPYNIKWDHGATTNRIEGLNEREYIYTVKDSNNCEIKGTIRLKAKHTTCIDIPTAFSPNNDGVNDSWNILAGDPDNYQLLSNLFPDAIVEVYNRWGDLIYRSEKGYYHEWNGRSGGKAMAMDSYYYSIDLGDGSEKWIGVVSIIK